MKNYTHATTKHLLLTLVIALTAAVCYLLFTSIGAPKASAQSCSDVNRDIGSGNFSITVAEASDYKVWLKIASPQSKGTLQLKLNQGCHKEAGASNLKANTLTWVNKYIDGSTISTSLNTGVNTFELVGVTDSLSVDQVLFVKGDCAPTGNGDNCAAENDRTVPQVSIVNPTDGPTVQGDVDMQAIVTDNDTDLTVKFYINDQEYGTASKNNMSEWNVQLISDNFENGTYNLRVEAIDSAGNVGSASRGFTINNESVVQPPTETSYQLKLAPTDDTFARSDKANSTNENSTLHTDGKPNKVTYLKFELPEGVTVTSAKLSLYSIRESNDQLELRKTSNNWNEDTLTWNNRPSVGSQFGTISGMKSNQWVEVDALSGIEQGSKYVSFAIQTDEDTLSRFNSKEKDKGETGPFLYVNVQGGTGGENPNDSGNTGGDSGDNGSSGPVNPPTTPTYSSSSHVVTEDAFARADQPTATAETNTLHTDVSPWKIIYLKFDVSSVAGKSVSKATLRLYNIESSENGGTVSTVNNDSWSEKTLNWNNRPTVNNDVLAQLGAVTDGRWVEVGLSLATIDNDGVITLAITSDSDDRALYQSKDKEGGVYAPELLLVTY